MEAQHHQFYHFVYLLHPQVITKFLAPMFVRAMLPGHSHPGISGQPIEGTVSSNYDWQCDANILDLKKVGLNHEFSEVNATHHLEYLGLLFDKAQTKVSLFFVPEEKP